jgi:hypothetical protein
MAVGVFIRYTGVSVREYDGLMARFGFDASPPIGEILHVAAEASDHLDVFEVWQTAEAAEMFIAERLRPALAELDTGGDVDYRIAPLHNVFAPDIETIERIGAVSLPAHVARSVLT